MSTPLRTIFASFFLSLTRILETCLQVRTGPDTFFRRVGTNAMLRTAVQPGVTWAIKQVSLLANLPAFAISALAVKAGQSSRALRSWKPARSTIAGRNTVSSSSMDKSWNPAQRPCRVIWSGWCFPDAAHATEALDSMYLLSDIALPTGLSGSEHRGRYTACNFPQRHQSFRPIWKLRQLSKSPHREKFQLITRMLHDLIAVCGRGAAGEPGAAGGAHPGGGRHHRRRPWAAALVTSEKTGWVSAAIQRFDADESPRMAPSSGLRLGALMTSTRQCPTTSREHLCRRSAVGAVTGAVCGLLAWRCLRITVSLPGGGSHR